MIDYYTELDKKKILIGQQERHLDARQLKDIPIFFVVGRPRSGTTLLRTLFDAHPNVIVPPECQFIINLYPKYGKIKNWSAEKLQAFYKELLNQWLFDLWPVNQARLLRNLLECRGAKDYNTICKVVYHEYQSVFNNGVLLAIGDKNPGYTIYTKKLLKIFPEAKFIHIVRDYRDNFISIRNVDFELPFISVTVTKWRLFVKKFRNAAKARPGTHIELKYEDLAAEPEKIFKELCEFVGIPFSKAPLDFHLKNEEALKIYPAEILKKYQASLFKKISTDRIGLWKKELKPAEVKVGDYCAGSFAESCGYERQYPKASFYIRIRSFPGICLAHLLSCATTIIDIFPYRLRNAILIKAPWVIGRMYLSLFNRNKLKEVSLAKKNTEKYSKDADWKPLIG